MKRSMRRPEAAPMGWLDRVLAVCAGVACLLLPLQVLAGNWGQRWGAMQWGATQWGNQPPTAIPVNSQWMLAATVLLLGIVAWRRLQLR